MQDFMNNDILNFVIESNRIEGITRTPTCAEIDELERFLALPVVTVAELERFVRIYQPGARLRDVPGLNVRVGSHVPPPGGPRIRTQLETLLADLKIISPHSNHLNYETLHPFTDGNGRCGRGRWGNSRSGSCTTFITRPSRRKDELGNREGRNMNQTIQMHPLALQSPALHERAHNYPPNYRGRVPWKIKMACTVWPDKIAGVSLNPIPGTVAVRDAVYECWVNSHGAVAVICKNGQKLGVKPAEFDVVEWHPSTISGVCHGS